MTDRTADQILRDYAVSQALEDAAKAVESRAGNPVYKRAWIIAAKLIRSMKPF